ncbi:cupin domain-containing protein [Massilia terrae]|uniref:Cupin domain-containing protein n=1 Tax=Massilia terrae TaxID=1811224 RepID=A0ABT2D2T3_9BURK|nr:cupin domain-containing protein [Massilia terrae]MCS0660553.1 cupin domain-containing protein [Massilia terrae]
MRKGNLISIFFVGACFSTSLALSSPMSNVIMVAPDQIKWVDLPLIPGAQIAILEGKMDKKGPITARIKFAPNTKIAAHWHPGIERVTVLSGTFNYGMGDKLDEGKTTALGAGSLIVMQPKMHHFAWTKDETIVQLNVTGPWAIHYVNPADDPRKK